MRHAIEKIAWRLREIISWIDFPLVAGFRMAGVNDAIQNRIAHAQNRMRHIDFGAQNALAGGEFARSHPPQQIDVFIRRAVAARAFDAGRAPIAAPGAHRFGIGFVDIREPGASQGFGDFV